MKFTTMHSELALGIYNAWWKVVNCQWITTDQPCTLAPAILLLYLHSSIKRFNSHKHMAGKNLLLLDRTSQDFRMVKIMFFYINVSFWTVRGKQMKQSLSASISLRYLCVLDPSISVRDNHRRFLTLLGSWRESLNCVGNPYNQYLIFLNQACQKHFLQYVWWKDPFFAI